MPAELFCDRLHLLRGDALRVHLRHGGHERLLGALIALKPRCLELPIQEFAHKAVHYLQLCAGAPEYRGTGIPSACIEGASLKRDQPSRVLGRPVYVRCLSLPFIERTYCLCLGSMRSNCRK